MSNLTFAQNPDMNSLDHHIPRSSSKDYKVDATTYLQNLLDDPYVTGFPAGFYYVTKTLTQTKDKVLFSPNATLYTDKDIDVLHIATPFSKINYLTIDVADVKEPNGKKLITYKHRNIHIQWGGLQNVRLLGNEVETREEDAGFIGVFFDSTDDSYPGKHDDIGESHFMHFDIQTNAMRYAFLASNKPEFNTHARANGAHELIKVKDIGSKQGIVLDGYGSAYQVYFRGQPRYVLTEKEKDYPLVYLNVSGVNLITRASDLRHSKNTGKISKKYKQRLYMHRYSVKNDGKHNTIDKNFAKWNLRYGHVIQNLPFENFKD